MTKTVIFFFFFFYVIMPKVVYKRSQVFSRVVQNSNWRTGSLSTGNEPQQVVLKFKLEWQIGIHLLKQW